MRLAHSIVILAALAVPGAAMASSVFGSGSSVVTYSNGSGSGLAVPYTGMHPYSTGNYVAPVPGTVYITYDDRADEVVPAGVTSYTTTFFGSAGLAGSLQFAADNSVVVFLNGIQIGQSATFTALTSANFTEIGGVNTLRFDVTNDAPTPGIAANPTALDFGGTAATPEPSSLALLGTGVLGLAGAARRRFSRS